jgi:hypothetical protein
MGELPGRLDDPAIELVSDLVFPVSVDQDVDVE